MTNISASLVKELRELTGAGMMDCKAALQETGGDLEGAVDWLRKKGLSKAAKKAGRTAADGLIGVVTEGRRGAMVEVNSETDFVARNDAFQAFVLQAAKHALEEEGDLERLLSAQWQGGGKATREALTDLIAVVGENMAVRRSIAFAVPHGVVASYIHNAVAPNLGKIGVLVAIESTGDATTLAGLGKQLAMHIAAASPLAVDVESLDQGVVARERTVQADIARQSGKPEHVIEKMLEGRMRKFYEESVLTSQVFVIDGETPVAKVIENAATDVGTPVKVVAFARFAVGEGVEKPEGKDFASEVASMTAGR
jgi:elongation factor Ts